MPLATVTCTASNFPPSMCSWIRDQVLTLSFQFLCTRQQISEHLKTDTDMLVHTYVHKVITVQRAIKPSMTFLALIKREGLRKNKGTAKAYKYIAIKHIQYILKKKQTNKTLPPVLSQSSTICGLELPESEFVFHLNTITYSKKA